MIKDELIQTFYGIDFYIPYHGWQTAPYAFADMEAVQEYLSRYRVGTKYRVITFTRSFSDDRYEEW